MATCLICNDVAVLKDYNLKRHYNTKHADHYAKYEGKERRDKLANFRKHCPCSKISLSVKKRNVMQ